MDEKIESGIDMSEANKEMLLEQAGVLLRHLASDFNPKDLPLEYYAVRQKIAERIEYLLEHDPEHLMFHFYRLDLNEKKVKEILSGGAPDKMFTELAEEMIYRAFDKYLTRMTYPQNEGDWNS